MQRTIFVSIRVHSWFFSSFKTVVIVLFLGGGIIGGFAKNYNRQQEFVTATQGLALAVDDHAAQGDGATAAVRRLGGVDAAAVRGVGQGDGPAPGEAGQGQLIVFGESLNLDGPAGWEVDAGDAMQGTVFGPFLRRTPTGWVVVSCWDAILARASMLAPRRARSERPCSKYPPPTD